MTTCSTIVTDRLIVRPFELNDTDPFYELMSDPEFAKIAGTEAPQSRDLIYSSIQVFMDLNNSGFYQKRAICLKESKEFIGECEIYPLKPQIRPWDEWVLGFSLSPKYWRQGFMFEALNSVIHELFSDLNILRIKADVHLGNEASVKILQKLGFKYEGVQRSKLKIYDLIYDMEQYSLTKGDVDK
jgi:ribosomal-protein-alanine N-acetyltransferase